MTIEKEVTQTIEATKPTFGTPMTKLWNVQKGLSRSLIEEISWQKDEPDWMRQKRLRSFEIFESKPMPSWGPDLSALKFDDLTFYTPPGSKKTRSWDEVPKDIKDTYENWVYRKPSVNTWPG